MALISGARLGTYEVVGALGAGGMGEVYRARDTQLNRDVAIKVLPELFALDAERLARFTREAQTLAALNHPQHRADLRARSVRRKRALVMELVDGDDLSTMIERGPLPVAEACRSPARSPTRSRLHTNSGSSIAISSRRTSRSGRTAP